MKVVILAGGLGTRLIEKTDVKPKPMVEVGDMPILLHIMKIYSYYGFNDFIICLGHKGNVITDFFKSYFSKNQNLEIIKSSESTLIIPNDNSDWKINLVDTGQDTMTGGRISRVRKLIQNNRFFLTYGDGLSNVNINSLLEYHKLHNKLCTVTAVKPEPRFGALILEDNLVKYFREKNIDDVDWVNGGYFVCEPSIFDYLNNDDKEVWEKKPLQSLSEDKCLVAYQHDGFWKPMDTLKDSIELNKMWQSNNAKWKIW
jgi:glucose-1-phosphate cytidylyltransferase